MFAICGQLYSALALPMVSSKHPEASRVRLAMLLRSSMAVDVSFIVDEAIGAVRHGEVAGDKDTSICYMALYQISFCRMIM